MRKYETIFWDVDDTLLDFGKSEDYALKQSFEKFGVKYTQDMLQRYSQINQSYWKRLELGEVDKLTVLCGRFADLFTEYDIPDIEVDAFRSTYQQLLGSVYFYLEESDQLLLTLKQAGFRQYIVTNGVASTQRNKLMLSGLDKLVDGLFISEELGAVKPDKAFFDGCFRRIEEFDKKKAILIGDSLSSDMKGAVGAGLSACWYCRKQTDSKTELPIDYTIHSLWEIKRILGI